VLDARQQRARFGVLARGQKTVQELDRLPGAVLAHERIREAAGTFGVPGRERHQRPPGLLRGRPVARHEPEPELHPQRPRALRRDRHRPLEQRRRSVEAPRGLGARGGREQHALEQVARLGGVTRVERFGVTNVLGRQRHLGVEPRDEPRRRRQVGGRRRIARWRLGHERRGRSGGRVLPQRHRLGQRSRAGRRRRVAGRAVAGRTHRRGFVTRLAQVHDGRADQQREAERGQKQAAPGR
jgi:hypothetical protein